MWGAASWAHWADSRGAAHASFQVWLLRRPLLVPSVTLPFFPCRASAPQGGHLCFLLSALPSRSCLSVMDLSPSGSVIVPQTRGPETALPPLPGTLLLPNLSQGLRFDPRLCGPAPSMSALSLPAWSSSCCGSLSTPQLVQGALRAHTAHPCDSSHLEHLTLDSPPSASSV